MFSDIEADIYVMVDAMTRMTPVAAPAMIRALIDEKLDMVNGVR